MAKSGRQSRPRVSWTISSCDHLMDWLPRYDSQQIHGLARLPRDRSELAGTVFSSVGNHVLESAQGSGDSECTALGRIASHRVTGTRTAPCPWHGTLGITGRKGGLTRNNLRGCRNPSGAASPKTPCPLPTHDSVLVRYCACQLYFIFRFALFLIVRRVVCVSRISS